MPKVFYDQTVSNTLAQLVFFFFELLAHNDQVAPKSLAVSSTEKHDVCLWRYQYARLDAFLIRKYGRLSHFYVENQNADGVVEDKLTQQDLADIVGSSRKTICRIYI